MEQLKLLTRPYKILEGDCREVLRTLAPESVQCVVTSPPYYALRDYDTATWSGGSPDCEHRAPGNHTKTFGNPEFNKNRPSRAATQTAGFYFRDECKLCGAKRIDKQIGIEASIAEYVESLVQVFDAVWDVLAKDGTVWLNLGDSYSGVSGNYAKNNTNLGQRAQLGQNFGFRNQKATGIRPKNLMGIPWRVAFALQDRGWILRSDIVWLRSNPMPCSASDRFTNTYEHIFLLTKSEKYYFDIEPIREVAVQGGTRQPRDFWEFAKEDDFPEIWNFNSKPYKGAHFATFPPELPRRAILAGSRPGSIVLDPFNGSGTTGMVALKHDREYIGIELNPEYIELAKQRIESGK